MLLKYFYDQALAHASYLVGCQRSGEAIVVDPGRDIETYLDAASREGVKIVGVAETHIHADYVSGARELADRINAKLYVSDAGPAAWKYEYVQAYRHQLLRDGDRFSIGNIEFETLFTPGHTPEHVSFLVTDRGGGANRPMGLFSGDFIFVGSIGRPDLLEEAAGVQGSADVGARQLFHSVQRFKALPDYLQIWPAHGAGSACGKGLGAIPSSTVGYEKLFNPALQIDDEQAFVDYILADQPEAPKYFAHMKRINKTGPDVLGGADLPPLLPVNSLLETAVGHQLVDTRGASAFAAGHVPGAWHLPPKYTASFGGWLIDYDRPVYLIGNPSALRESVRILRKIGVDRLAGYYDEDRVAAAGLNTQRVPQAKPGDVAPAIQAGESQLIDVRGLSEWNTQRIPQAQHIFLGRLLDRLGEIPKETQLVMQCRTGGRSLVAASVLQAAGFDSVVNLDGGIEAWMDSGLHVDCDSAVSCAAS